MANRAVGIDLGTTNSVIAQIKATEPRVIDNEDSEPLTPSVVYLTEANEWVVGKGARHRGGSSPENTVFSIKRFMGRDFDDPECARDIAAAPYKMAKSRLGEVDVLLRGRAYSPPEISAVILESLKRGAEAYLDASVSHAVITVPAYFGNRQREVTRLAGRLAGLNVMRIIPEPTAAALAYGFAGDMSEAQTVLVYDLGGGTFDVTVMFIAAGLFEDQGKSGDMHLGGDDFDQRIMDWLVEQIRIQHGIDIKGRTGLHACRAMLKSAAEEAKIRLSRTSRTEIIIPALNVDGRDIHLQCELTREEFNRMIKPQVDRSIDLVHEAIRVARTTVDGIDKILLVGGSTKVPLVEETVRQIFGEKVIHGEVNPMHCVAQGAAIQTMMAEEVGRSDETPLRKCPHCGVLNLPERADCRCCARTIDSSSPPPPPPPPAPPLENEVVCLNCKSRNPFGTKVCNQCQQPMDAPINTTPLPTGVQVVGDKMEVVIPPGTAYPTRGEPHRHTFKTNRPGQSEVAVPIYEGFEAVASANQYLGQATSHLPDGLPEGTAIELSFSLDSDGIIFLDGILPERPNGKLDFNMDWKGRGATSPSQYGSDEPHDPHGPGQPISWKDQAQFMLFQAAAVKNEGEGLISPAELAPLMQKAAELLTALQTEDQARGIRLMAELEKLIEPYQVFVMLGMMRVLSQNNELITQVPTSQRKEFEDLMARLQAALSQADRARQLGAGNDMARAVMVGQDCLQQIIQIISEGDRTVPLSNLLRGSSSDLR